MSPQKRYVGVLAPGTSGCELIEKEGLYRGNQAKMRSLECTYKSDMTDVLPYEKGNLCAQRHTHTGNMPCEVRS